MACLSKVLYIGEIRGAQNADRQDRRARPSKKLTRPLLGPGQTVARTAIGTPEGKQLIAHVFALGNCLGDALRARPSKKLTRPLLGPGQTVARTAIGTPEGKQLIAHVFALGNCLGDALARFGDALLDHGVH